MRKIKIKENPFIDFFKEDDKDIKEVISGDNSSDEKSDNIKAKVTLPKLPTPEQSEENELNAFWQNLRTFFRTAKGGGFTKKRTHNIYPALLSLYFNKKYLPSGYPFWVADINTTWKNKRDVFSGSLRDILASSIEEFAPENEDARILKDNLLRLELIVNNKMSGSETPVAFKSTITASLDTLSKQLAIKGDEGKVFSEDIRKLKNHLPSSGSLINFSIYAPFQLFIAAWNLHVSSWKQNLKKEISKIQSKLNEILLVEKEKGPDSRDPRYLESTMDVFSEYFNFDELASVLPEGGSTLMPQDRYDRINQLLNSLNKADKLIFNKKGTIYISKKLLEDKSLDWEKIFDGWILKGVTKGSSVKEVEKAFDAEMGSVSEVIAAMRLGNLEIKEIYDPQLHQDYFNNFSWQSFSAEEMAACQSMIYFDEASVLTNEELNGLSHMLSSGKPIKTIAIKHNLPSNFKLNGTEHPGELVFKQELGMLSASHRNTFTLQSSVVSPKNIFDGFETGLKCFFPSLFYLLSPNNKLDIDPYLWLSAAVEGRMFPGFTYNYEQGMAWGSRFSIDNNPQKDLDWPVAEFKYTLDDGTKENMQIPFTYADFAVLEAVHAANFLIVPPEYWSDDLVQMGEYLEIPQEENYSKVPFIWMLDNKNVLQKAAVAWPLVVACRERIDFWHSLQENAGVNSYHVQQAFDEISEKMKTELEEEINTLKKDHEQEIEEVKEKTAGEAMEKLTAILLDLDTNAIIPSSAPTTAPPPADKESVADDVSPQEKEKEEEEEEDLSLGDPWIETALCTSCNECTDLNGQLFNYNADKLAFIADPKAGTFAEIVKAAEVCPVSIIHPGKPLNPEEPGLDDLIKRAEKFN